MFTIQLLEVGLSNFREVTAESVAYTVLSYLNIAEDNPGEDKVGEYSFGYICGWSSGKDLKELKASI